MTLLGASVPTTNPDFNWDLRVPFGYSNTYVTLRYLNTWLLVHHDPEFVRRIISYLHSKQGNVGVGGGWRAGGQQPDKPGFAPEGRSFHQDQRFATGFVGAAALDLVYKDGPDAGDAHDYIAWHEIPVQGSTAAHEFGIHANVGVPGNGESWHVQWCDEHRGGYDLDGWVSWVTAGRPGPIPDHPLPPAHDPDYVAPVVPPLTPPITPPKERSMYGIKMGPPITSPSRVHRPREQKVTGVVLVKAVDPTAPATLGANAVDVIVEAKGVEGDGWINCNGVTVTALKNGENTLTVLPPMPVDENGMLELVINQSSCHLIIDRANHRLPVA